MESVKMQKLFILLFLFAIVTIFVCLKFFNSIDTAILYFFQNISGVTLYDNIMWMFTEISNIFSCVIFCIILIILKKTRRIGLSSLLSVLVSTIVCGYISYLADRDSPNMQFIGSKLPLEIENDTLILGTDNSYPSGHIARIVVIVATILHNTKNKYTYFVLILPFISSIGRLYMLQHYPTDIIGGVIIGLSIEMIISSKLNKLHQNII